MRDASVTSGTYRHRFYSVTQEWSHNRLTTANRQSLRRIYGLRNNIKMMFRYKPISLQAAFGSPITNSGIFHLFAYLEIKIEREREGRPW